MSVRVNDLIHAFRAEDAPNLPGVLPSLKDLFPLASDDQPVIGMFHSSGDPAAAEILAGAGFDYLLIDGEHSPLSLETIQSVLRAIAAYPTLGVVHRRTAPRPRCPRRRAPARCCTRVPR